MRTDHLQHTPECFASYIDAKWAISASWLSEALSELRAGTYPIDASVLSRPAGQGERGYQLLAGGVAMIPLSGVLQKTRSKFGGTSTIEARRALRQAATDDDVRTVLLMVDSPGGQVAGTYQLDRDVRAVAERKPVHAHIEDLGASAAVWAISGATRITAEEPARIGSIGTYAVLTDTSKRAELEGVEVRVVSTAPLKGAGEPGTPLTEEIVDDVQRQVDEMNAMFMSALRSGRSFGSEELKAVADGRTWAAPEALALGLIDAVSSADEVIASLTAPQGMSHSERVIAMSR